MRKLLVTASLFAALTAAAQFKPEAIRAHMRFLASDLLEGRGAGTRGYDLAAEYVASQYAAFGLEPGNGDSYFQQVPFRKTRVQPASTMTVTPKGGQPIELKFGEGFSSGGDALNADRAFEGDVVFVGYGITAPEQSYDSYKSVDVRGKIVAIFSGAPKTFPNALRAHYSSSTNKIENAAAHGAVGYIGLTTPTDAARYPFPRVVRQHALGAMHWLRADGTPSSVDPNISATASLSPTGMETLFTGSPTKLADVIKSVDEGKPSSFALPVHAKYRIVSTHEKVSSPNVVGIVRGSDPKLRDEYLVYSSHLDHLGISEPVDGDAINNGALDNASGIGATLEIARVMAELKPHPKRSVLFLATTAEEKGLRGADYFATNPTVPKANIVGNINIDEIWMLVRTRDLVALGAETNDLGDTAARIAKAMKFDLSPDPFPEEVFFVRSDQYPFVKQGIPAIYVGVGYKAVDPNVDAAKIQEQWMVERYHNPKDDMTQPMNFDVAVMLTEFNYRLGLEVANAPNRPRWKPGDFFGEKFGKNR
ncbi:MAG TPA: M28 family metallopeptidase [Thermoanaerobaculia bacterium]|jgi:hypothetical protein